MNHAATSAAVALAFCLGAGCGHRAAVNVVSTTTSVLGESDRIVGRDGGVSAKVWGRSIWTFGDTVTTVPDENGDTWHHNSWGYTDDFDASDGLTLTDPLGDDGAPRYLIAPTATELEFNLAHKGDDCAEQPCGARYAVWPGAPVFDSKRGRALIPFEVIYAEVGQWNFEGRGSSYAVWDAFDEAPTRLPTIWEKDEPAFTIAPQIPADDDHLYAFACPDESKARKCRLGRVSLDSVEDRSAWRYFDGDGWSSATADAKTLFDGAPIMAVSFNAYLDAWTVVYAPPLENAVVMRTAPDIWGPWSGPAKLADVDRGQDETWVYDAVHHAELEEGDGRVQYITYSRSTGDWFAAEFALLRVELERR